jgi:hypothetical protein
MAVICDKTGRAADGAAQWRAAVVESPHKSGAARCCVSFVVAAVAAITSHTSEGSLDNPTFWQDDKLLSVRGFQHFFQELTGSNAPDNRKLRWITSRGSINSAPCLIPWPHADASPSDRHEEVGVEMHHESGSLPRPDRPDLLAPPKRDPRRRHDCAGRHVPDTDKEQQLARIVFCMRPFHDPQK